MRIRIRIQQLKLMRIHADPDPKPCRYVFTCTAARGASDQFPIVSVQFVTARRGFALNLGVDEKNDSFYDYFILF
jgi:hypothetical protein